MSAQPPPLVICGPSGVGKSVLIKYLQKVFPGKFGFSVSHTTRKPRPGEEDGVAYHFVDQETMEKAVEAGSFIESATVHGNMYGTSKEAVLSVGRSGRICILDIDVQGAKSIRDGGCFKQTRFIFINPPSMEELERRLRGRGTETEDKVQRRLANARLEIEFSLQVDFFDFIFVLDGLSGGNAPRAVQGLCALLRRWYSALAGPDYTDIIFSVRAREVFDSQGRPAAEVEVFTPKGLFRAAAPSGPGSAAGPGALAEAAAEVNGGLGSQLLGMRATQQAEIDKLLTRALGRVGPGGRPQPGSGAGAAMALSMAVCRAGAAAAGVPVHEHVTRLAGGRTDRYTLPVPSLAVLDFGSCAGNGPARQELVILPTGADSFKEAMTIGAEVYHVLRGIIRQRCGQDACNVCDHGGFAPKVQDCDEALQMLMQAIRQSGHVGKVSIGARVGGSAAMQMPGEQLMALYKRLFLEYPLVSIEDPFDQDSWDACSVLTSDVGKRGQIVLSNLAGDPHLIAKARHSNSCNTLLLVLDQIHSLTDVIELSREARSAGWRIILSHRTEGTEDAFIANLAVGLHIGRVEAGGPCRSEWVAKYNELLRIEEVLGSTGLFAGHGL